MINGVSRDCVVADKLGDGFNTEYSIFFLDEKGSSLAENPIPVTSVKWSDLEDIMDTYTSHHCHYFVDYDSHKVFVFGVRTSALTESEYVDSIYDELAKLESNIEYLQSEPLTSCNYKGEGIDTVNYICRNVAAIKTDMEALAEMQKAEEEEANK